MAVHITRVYTRIGDDGTTALGTGPRVSKTDPRIAAYADVDETNATLGVVLALGNPPAAVAEILRQVQNDLFDVGADLCTPIVPNSEHQPLRITPAYTQRLETWCDHHNTQLSTLNSFILPGGSRAAALLHHSRTVARRAERSTWALIVAEPERTNPETARYLNRLSDLLFVLARTANPTGDIPWAPGPGA